MQEHVETYYASLRAGEPLAPFFADRSSIVKFGIHEHLFGESVARGLEEQSDRTIDWTVTSYRLRTGESGDAGWFSDFVTLGWTDTEREQRYDLDTRWSGAAIKTDDGWQFVTMHVSVPYAFFASEDTRVEDWIDTPGRS